MNKKTTTLSYFRAGVVFTVFASTLAVAGGRLQMPLQLLRAELASSGKEASVSPANPLEPAAAAAAFGPGPAGNNDNDLVLDASDLDDDNDGIRDTVEGTTDTDGDGLNNSFDLDSDDDGIPDAVEANNGVLPTGMDGTGSYPIVYVTTNDGNGNGMVAAVETTALPDADQDGDTYKNRLDRDSDNDGLVDLREANGGALPTTPTGITGEGDLNTAAANDVLRNGLRDTFDPSAGGMALANPNTDEAGRPDFLDLDSDDDGATDWFEAQQLNNTNPIIRANPTTADADADGILDVNDVSTATANALVPFNTDASGVPDYIDTDSDDDGVSDRIELQDDNRDGAADLTYATTDTDNDGLVDVFDSLDNGTTGVTNLIGNTITGSVPDYGMASPRPNADYDYLPDWRDTDDDNDGILTSAEASGGNYLVYTQGGSATLYSYAATPAVVNVPDYLQPKRAGSLRTDRRMAVLNWNDGTFTDGSAGGGTATNSWFLDGDTYKRGGVNVVISQFSTTSTPQTTTIPQPATQAFGALTFPKNPILETDRFLTYGNKLQQSFFQTIGTANRISTAIYRFSQPVRNLTFGISDLDYGAGGYVDDIEIVGYRNGTAVTLPAADVAYNAYVHTLGASSVPGSQRVVAQSTTNFTVPSKQAAGNVWVSFSVPVDELRLIYRNGNSLTGVQIIGISDLRFTNPDFDGDNVADGTQSTTADDLDSDNDGIPDLAETGNTDVFADADSDGIPNYLDSNTAGWVDTNTDGVDDRYDRDLDGQINPLDRDSDNDGIADVREAGGPDANGDGILDGFTDSNGNGQDDTRTLSSNDLDGDGLADYLDLDSDNDGIADTREARQAVIVDATNNGIADAYAVANADLNFDGIADAVVTATTPADADADNRPDYLDRDSDNDGITDTRESGGTDADGDGVVDGFADTNGDGLNGGAGNTGIVPTDFDGDGIANYLDRDSDQDGIADVREVGLADTDGNGIVDGGTFDNDNDGLINSVDPNAAGGVAPTLLNSDGESTAANPDYLDRDSDNDGITDTREAGGIDANGDGIIDGFADTNGDGLNNTALTLADFDGDGIVDSRDRDSDNDGITDTREAGYADSTNNGISDAATTDANADGLFDAAVTTALPTNTDGVAGANYLDRDSDNDGITDAREAGGTDANNDGIIDGFTNQGFGLYAATGLNPANFDTDGLPNYLDLDSDQDGLPDTLEAGGTDTDGNGIVDGYADSNNDGLTNSALAPADFDGDGLPNYLDRDADNDGIWDLLEAQPTAGRRALSGADTDNDGIDNSFDGNTAAANAISSLNNADATDSPDYLDLNADNDRYSDFYEGFDDDKNGVSLNDLKTRATNFVAAGGNAAFYQNTADADADSIPDYLEDADADGVANLLDPNSTFYRDSDADGLVDLFDPTTFGAASGTPSRAGGEADFRRTDTVTPLPVELKAFEVVASNASAVLTWSTASEKNNDHFDVERSFNGGRFERIGQVRGQGTTSQTTTYRFTDAHVGAQRTGVVYYRLQQVDTDGTASYSPVRTVQFAPGTTAGTPAIVVYPNPATSQDRTVTLVLTTLPAGSYEVRVLDATGRVVRAQSAQGGQEQLLPVQQLPAGVYLVQVQGQGLNLTQRFSKQ